MECGCDVISEVIEGGKKAEELSETWGDGDSKHGVPDEKTNDRSFGDLAFFPGDFGMCKIGNDDSDGCSDKVREPEEVVVLNDKMS